jgi:hypothetical protein
MSVVARLKPGSLVLLALLGCGGGPSGPSGTSLTVNILGLPTGASGSVVVSGPGGFTQTLASTQTFSQISPGNYTVNATDVSPGGTQYSASPLTQSVAVMSNPVTATVQYSTSTGSLAVNISGLGTSKSASVTVSGPGYSHFLNASATLSGLVPGDYTVSAASPAAAGCTNNIPSPSSQIVTVQAKSTKVANVSYAPAASGTVNLCIAGMYLIQSAQNLAGSVPLVQNRSAYLRVFVVADQPNTVPPSLSVRLRVFQNSVLMKTDSVVKALAQVPSAIDESSLNNSWNYLLPSQYIQPGLSIEATVDPGNTVAESNDSDNVYQLSSPDVRSVPTVPVTFVPVLQLSTNQQGNITDANKNSFFAVARSMHPINGVDLQVRANPMSTSTTLQSNGDGWQTVLDQVNAAAAADPTGRYYYGVAKVSYTSGVAGIAYVSTPSVAARAALGWDALPSAGTVVAHELAHNWGRMHAPCGGPAQLDPSYPDPAGLTDGFGIDLSTGTPTLKPDTMTDIMGYCASKWVSNYTYRGVFDYLAPALPISAAVANQPPQPALLVWGHDGADGLVLEPAFRITARPTLPSSSGPYQLEARASDGSLIFSHSFAMNEVADLPGGHRSFAFAVPLSEADAGRLSTIHLSGAGRSTVLSAATLPATAPGAATGPEVRRRAGGRVGLRWDAAMHPMVMVRDPETGQVLAFARGGEAEVYTSKPEVDLVLSNGVASQVRRVRVQ